MGGLSRFSQKNPAVYRTGDALIGLNWNLNDKFGVDLAYLVGNGAANPNEGNVSSTVTT